MIIPINDRYRLKSDPSCWHLQMKAISKKGLETWQSRAYFPTVSSALSYLVELDLRLAQGNTLSEAVAHVKRLTTELTRALKPHIEVDIK